jgi:hypothetical protein
MLLHPAQLSCPPLPHCCPSRPPALNRSIAPTLPCPASRCCCHSLPCHAIRDRRPAPLPCSSLLPLCPSTAAVRPCIMPCRPAASCGAVHMPSKGGALLGMCTLWWCTCWCTPVVPLGVLCLAPCCPSVSHGVVRYSCHARAVIPGSDVHTRGCHAALPCRAGPCHAGVVAAGAAVSCRGGTVAAGAVPSLGRTSVRLWKHSSSMVDRGTTAHSAMTCPSCNTSVGLLMEQLLMPALTVDEKGCNGEG